MRAVENLAYKTKRRRSILLRETVRTEYLFDFLDRVSSEDQRSKTQIVFMLINDALLEDRGAKKGKQVKL